MDGENYSLEILLVAFDISRLYGVRCFLLYDFFPFHYELPVPVLVFLVTVSIFMLLYLAL